MNNRDDYINSNSTSINHFFEKLLKLKNLMLTDSGKKEASQRHQLMIDFLYQYFDEEEAEEWKTYLKNYLLELS